MLLTLRNLTTWTAALLLLMLFSLLPSGARSAPLDVVPEKLQAALFIKIMAMSKELSSGEDITIHVVRAPGVAAELKKAVGRAVGRSTIVAINNGDGPPDAPPTALYVGEGEDADALIRYCRENGVLSITGTPALVEKGVTLGVAFSDDKPKILLHIRASKAEGITWNPTLLKISKLYK